MKHVPLEMGPQFSRSDVEIEQELSRPYVYASRIMNPTFGFDIISIEDPNNAEVIYEWRIEDAELHVGPWRHGSQVLQATTVATTWSSPCSSPPAGRTWTSVPSSST